MNRPSAVHASPAPAPSGAKPDGVLPALMQSGLLYCVFQPIGDLRSGAVFAHEALIRGPKDSIYQRPDALFALAEREGASWAFDWFCLCQALEQWGRMHELGRLFVNISADALVHACAHGGPQVLVEAVQARGVQPRMLVLEITEHERVGDMDQLHRIALHLHAAGIALALDDFGDGRSSLRLWTEVRPDYVKIDKYFTREVSRRADKLQMLRALQGIAEVFGASLIAEGIETDEDLRVLRDLQWTYGQGYLLGHPLLQPVDQLQPEAVAVLQDRRVAVLPHWQKNVRPNALRGLQVIYAPAVSPSASNNDVAARFLQRPDLHALAVTEAEQPLALINREQFMNHYATLYFRELHGRKPCLMFANRSPRLIELDYDVEELVGILTSQDQRYLRDGFIVTENGRYVGLGTGDQLVRTVTEARIEAARHANPLTFLPGNIPISQHLERLLASGAEFVACYADLNHFKPFNDLYGYWRGDEMIRLVARLCVEHADPQRDFVGHVGGDDFILLFQSADWHTRCEQLIAAFAEQAQALFDEQARRAGGIRAEDRHGVVRFFPCTTLAIGAVPVWPGWYQSAEQVANDAALAKHEAKQSGAGLRCRPRQEGWPQGLRA